MLATYGAAHAAGLDAERHKPWVRPSVRTPVAAPGATLQRVYAQPQPADLKEASNAFRSAPGYQGLPAASDVEFYPQPADLTVPSFTFKPAVAAVAAITVAPIVLKGGQPADVTIPSLFFKPTIQAIAAVTVSPVALKGQQTADWNQPAYVVPASAKPPVLPTITQLIYPPQPADLTIPSITFRSTLGRPSVLRAFVAAPDKFDFTTQPVIFDTEPLPPPAAPTVRAAFYSAPQFIEWTQQPTLSFPKIGIALPTGNMPNVVGMHWQQATAVLIQAGIVPDNGLVPTSTLPSVGYFDKWPVAVQWVTGTTTKPYFVIAQSPLFSTNAPFGTQVTLFVASPPFGVSSEFSAGGYS